METLARQLLVELRGCPCSVLGDKNLVGKSLISTARTMGVEVVFAHLCENGPDSMVGIAVAHEAHLVITSWPSQGVAAVDIMASTDIPVAHCVERLCTALNASDHVALEVGRGAFNAQQQHPPAAVFSRSSPVEPSPLVPQPPRPCAV